MSTHYDPTAVVAPSDVTPEWLTTLLRSRGLLSDGAVLAVDCSAFGTGQMAQSLRFQLEYDSAGSGPASIIGKFPSPDPASREFGISRGLYENEVRFYDEIAPALSIAVPTALHAAIGSDGLFTLLLEDLAPALVVDQLAGSTADQMAAAVEQLARFHAASWGDSDLAARPWLRSIAKGFAAVVHQLPELSTAFVAEFGDVVPEDDLRELALFARERDSWMHHMNVVRCLWHQDYRLDNLLFDAKDGRIPVAIVDWQTVGMANGVIDLPYLIGGGLSVELRRVHERELVKLYHDVMTAQGVTGYDVESCWRDYRILAAHGLAGLVVGATSVQRTPRGDEMWRVWAQRHAAQTRDHETFDLLAGGE